MRTLLLALLLSRAPMAPESSVQATTAVTSIGLTVADLGREIDFFARVLDFELLGTQEDAGETYERLEGVFGLRKRVARLRLGAEVLELTEFLAPEGAPYPAGSRSNDRWFQHAAIVVADMGRAYARLRASGVRHASSGPQRLPDWNPAAGGIEAFYFKDPEGHVLELIAFPPGKGAPRWHEPGRDGSPFLGIDHTAIVVADTDASLSLYRDVLGLRVAGTSENFGTEQEHLNNVFGARLRITSLQADEGPGVELLEYLAPSDGRPYPPDAASNDLVHWETRIAVDDLRTLEPRLRAAGFRFVSAAPVELQDGLTALLVRDRDGHALELHHRSPTRTSDLASPGTKR